MLVPNRQVLIKKDQFSSFQENGFLLIKKVLPNNFCIKLRELADKYANGRYVFNRLWYALHCN